MALAAHTLAESYSGLTSHPRPYRLAPHAAWRVIEEPFLAHASVVALDANGYVELIRSLAVEGVAGGRSYDAIIVATARAAEADELLTFNERHFRQFEGDGLTIVVP